MSSFPRTLSEGIKGKDVASLRKALVKKARYKIPLEELKQRQFGKGTFEAVKKFQSDSRLNATGVVSKATAKLLVKKFIAESGLRIMVTTTNTATAATLRIVTLRTNAITTIVNLQGRNLSLRMRGDEL